MRHLEATEQTFEGRGTVVDGLDIQLCFARTGRSGCASPAFCVRTGRNSVYGLAPQLRIIMHALEREMPGHQPAIHHMQLPADPAGVGRGQE